ncbi:MAG: NfeD family protein [Actinobacteria bacterium]|nr:NfeD family protein [Actinomycetota bacterium]
MTLWFWIWLLLAAMLLIGEIFTAGFFMLPFGIGAAVAALLAFLGVALVWQWLAFIGVSAACFIFLKNFANRITAEQPIKTGVDRLVGMTGVVTEEILPHSSSGKVLVDRETWRAEASDAKVISVGARVHVERVGGTHLVVKVVEQVDSEVNHQSSETEAS